MNGKTNGSTGNLSKYLKNHIDKIDPSIKKQAEFMDKFLNKNNNDEKIVNIQIVFYILFFFQKKINLSNFFYRNLTMKIFETN